MYAAALPQALLHPEVAISLDIADWVLSDIRQSKEIKAMQLLVSRGGSCHFFLFLIAEQSACLPREVATR